MDKARIVQNLEAAEAALATGRGLKGTGFWRAVDAARADPEVVESSAAVLQPSTLGHSNRAFDSGYLREWEPPCWPRGLGQVSWR